MHINIINKNCLDFCSGFFFYHVTNIIYTCITYVVISVLSLIISLPKKKNHLFFLCTNSDEKKDFQGIEHRRTHTHTHTQITMSKKRFNLVYFCTSFFFFF